MRQQMKRLFELVCVLSLGLLTGCASMRLIDSEVVSVSAAAPGKTLQNARYRFERLPSQTHNPEAGLAEQQAQAAMAAVGLVRDDAGAQLSVLVGFSGTSAQVDAWGQPWSPFGRIALGTGMGSRVGVGMGMGMGMRFPPTTQYRREVSLIMRDLQSGQVVYETRASHDGPWRDSVAIFGTLFQAAMANFPNPPAGMRRVNIQLPQ